MPMGESITNLNIDEFISSYIDKQISDPQTVKKIEEMLKGDENLRKKYESELLTKNLLKSRLKNAEVPKATYMKVTAAVDKMIADASKQTHAIAEEEPHPIAASANFADYLKRILTIPIRIGSFGVPRYAAAMVVILLVLTAGLYVNGKFIASPSNERLITGSEKNIMKDLHRTRWRIFLIWILF